MEGTEKEVYFDVYCSKCKYGDKEEWEDPCDECLNHWYNIDSHKPVLFKNKEE